MDRKLASALIGFVTATVYPTSRSDHMSSSSAGSTYDREGKKSVPFEVT